MMIVMEITDVLLMFSVFSPLSVLSLHGSHVPVLMFSWFSVLTASCYPPSLLHLLLLHLPGAPLTLGLLVQLEDSSTTGPIGGQQQ